MMIVPGILLFGPLAFDISVRTERAIHGRGLRWLKCPERLDGRYIFKTLEHLRFSLVYPLCVAVGEREVFA